MEDENKTMNEENEEKECNCHVDLSPGMELAIEQLGYRIKTKLKMKPVGT